MPSWLTPYPEAKAETKASLSALIEVNYATPAKQSDVVAHYQQLFETAGFNFNPVFDGLGTSIRGSAAECDLLIKVREENGGTAARVSCATRSTAPVSGGDVIVTKGPGVRNDPRFGASLPSPTGSGRLDADQFRAEHLKRMDEGKAALDRHVANVRAGKGNEQVWPHAPENDAPELVWPSWLVHINGSRLSPQSGVDQSKDKYLMSKYVTTAPMSAIFNFYEDLLNANGYRVYSSKLGTGQTLGNVSQNADGYVEGSHETHGMGGPRTVIRVSFSRFYLNEPISVRIKLTAHPRF